MNYWEGYMDWPLDKEWRCEICGGRALTWGIVHAMCRCDRCHVHYMMRDKGKDEVITVPRSIIKPEYGEAFKTIFRETSKRLEDVADEEWDKAGVSKAIQEERKNDREKALKEELVDLRMNLANAEMQANKIIGLLPTKWGLPCKVRWHIRVADDELCKIAREMKLDKVDLVKPRRLDYSERKTNG